MQRLLSRFQTYVFCILFILAWWMLAFKQGEKTPPNTLKETIYAKKRLQPYHHEIAYLDRDELKRALAGDFSLASKLILDWDVDAQFLQTHFSLSSKRLSNEQFLRSQWLSRQLQNKTVAELKQIEENMRKPFVVDNTGAVISLEYSFTRFLPQTYASASFLLALSSPKEIVALPRHMRENTQLYSKEYTDSIALDVDRYNSEKLFLAKPEIAFIAHYSHPATIEALANQRVILYTMRNPASLKEISEELERIGHIVNHPLKAELLKIFMEAALLAVDNYFIYHTAKQNHFSNFLFLNYHQGFSIPTGKTLTSQLLNRICALKRDLKNLGELCCASSHWTVPVDKEQIMNLNPDCLIVATEMHDTLESQMRNDRVLRQLPALQKGHLYFVDQAIQESPSQYIVLAYFDLVHALARFNE